MNKKLLIIVALAAGLAPVWPGRALAQETERLTLRQAVTLALQNSRELALAKMQYNVALNQTRVYRSEFLPNLYTGSGAAYTNGFPATPSGQAPSLFNLTYTESVFNLPLLGQMRAAEDRAKSMKVEVDRMRDDVIVRAATAYLELAKVRHSLELLRKEEASAEKILEVTRERAAAGQELPIEITRGELTLARARERIIRLEGREEVLAQQIRNLTGIPDTQSVEVETEEPSFAAEQQESELLSQALENNPLVKEAENERAARAHLLKGEKGGYWPTMSVVGLYEVLGRFNNYNQFFNPESFQRNNITIGVDVHVPLFSAKTRANVALAKSQLSVAELTLGTRRQQVSLDVQQKARSVRELDAGREVARLDLKLAQETLQIEQEKFNQGRATLRDIEQARLDESDKWVAFLDADFARQQGQLVLLQATGQLAKVFQ
ncbi:MAG TPA: TolC family protein [Candidatus Sulfotelmatobacter sp.]|nr:TolC family protein [Candidatus Sulfotelmatobacter sp.]